MDNWTEDENQSKKDQSNADQLYNQTSITTRIKLDKETIKIVDKMNILGVTIDNQLCWNENTANLVRKLNQRMRLLRAVWSFGSNIPEMVHLWKVYCLSVLEQSCVVWGSLITQENKDDLERTQKSFAKLILKEKYVDYNSALRTLGLSTLEDRRTHLMTTFAESSIENGKLHNYFKLRETTHQMILKKTDLDKTPNRNI